MVANIDVKILKDAKDRIEDPSRWCRIYVAMDDASNSVTAQDPRAIKWCAWGSIVRSLDKLQVETKDCFSYLLYLSGVARELGYKPNIITLNDDIGDKYGHGPVIEVFNRAIEKLEKGDPVSLYPEIDLAQRR